MEPTPSIVRRSYDSAPPIGTCAYCGAPLNAFYYFCLRCATPYKSDDALLPVVHPVTLTDAMRIRKAAPQVWTVFWTYAAVIVALTAITLFIFQDRGTLPILILGSLGIGVTTIVFASLYWPSLASQFQRFGFFHWAAWAGLAALAPLLGLNFVYHNALRALLESEHYEMPSRLHTTDLGPAALIILLCILPAITEEIAFRGLVQHWLTTALSPFRSVFLASVLFAALHASILSFPYLLLVGMLLGAVKYKTKSLYPSMLIHFLHNLVVVLWMRL